MAEADWLLQDVSPTTYNHLSASMAVALAMRSAHLVEQAEAAFAGIDRHHGPELQLFVAQESALLSAYWATALLTLGRTDEAAAHLGRTASRAALMRGLAQRTSQPSMQARADVIEAYALLHLGEPGAGLQPRPGRGARDSRRGPSCSRRTCCTSCLVSLVRLVPRSREP